MARNSQSRKGRKPLTSWDPGPIRYPKELPIAQRRSDILSAIKANPVIILSGETGSGKTTQIPKMCVEADLGRTKRIACTQPRRVAALSIAKRVAEELNVEYGKEVGSKIRFSDKTSPDTRIKFMTDGMLLSEVQSDPQLTEYDTIIIDEAHERSLNIDFLLGHLNQLRKRRPDLKIVITSATIDTDKFSRAFDDAPILEVSGRVYPVGIVYAPLDELLEDADELTFLRGIAESVDRIFDEFGQGDILAFLPTEKDIRETMSLLEGRLGNRCAILPCFGRLSNSDQQRIFQRSDKRKIVLATNIAETSLTIPGIRFVIDTGLARISRYNPRARTKRLPIENISQSSANQRAGRCGRVQDGICIRLYSESDFNKRIEFSIPEIQRSNLAEVILRMKASNLGEIEGFPFIDPPSAAAIKSGYSLLEELGALQPDRTLTALGKKLARLPIDPTAGRMLLEAEKKGVVDQMLVIASALTVPDPRERPLGKEESARIAQKPFVHKHSDFLSLLNVWESAHPSAKGSPQGKLRKFCKSHFISYLRMREWRDVKEQLSQALRDFERSSRKKHDIPSYQDGDEKTRLRQYGGIEYRSIHQCLASGLLANPARKEEPNFYRATGDRKVMLFPGSCLFNRKALYAKTKKQKQDLEQKKPSPEWILAAEIVETNRLYARTVAVIDPTWIAQLGSHILKHRYSDPVFELDQGRVVCRESVRIHGLELQRKTVSYLKVDPDKATEIFIREGLLNDDFEAPLNWDFIAENRKLKNRMQNAQTIAKMQSWIGIEEAAFRFYRGRLSRIASIGDLNRVLKKSSPDSLLMTESDLSPEAEAPIDLSSFPESIQLENRALPIEYSYDLGADNDGVTLSVPYQRAKALRGPLLDWLVPGHLEPKILYLLKALPKEIRRKLQPLADTAKEIAQELTPNEASLCECLTKHLKLRYRIETYASDWNEDAIPNHLKVRVRVHDTKGETVIEGRSAEAIHQSIDERESNEEPKASQAIDSIWRKALERHTRPIDTLDQLESLPHKTQIGDLKGVPVFAYPVLRCFGSQIKTTLARTTSEQRDVSNEGIRALIKHEIRRELAWIQEDLKDFSKLGPVAVAFSSLDDLRSQAYQHLCHFLCSHDLDRVDKTAIASKIKAAKTKSRGLVYKLMDRVQEILDRRQAMIVSKSLPKDLLAEVDRLVPADFLVTTPHWALNRLPLYLEGVTLRSQARAKGPKRDADREAILRSLRNRLGGQSLTRDQRDDIAWSIEELALALFAQSLGTAFPVSEKRIQKKLDDAALNRPESSKQTLPQDKASSSAKPTINKPTEADLKSLKSLFSDRSR